MTSVSQTIPTYAIGGISNQPDELKKPGQVRDCLNAFPDLVDGLYKRNGFDLLGYLQDRCFNKSLDEQGSWFTFVRENLAFGSIENFVGKVGQDGDVHVFDLETGRSYEVFYSNSTINPNDGEGIDLSSLSLCQKPSYLQHNKNNALRFNAINNYTFITNPAVAVTMNTKTRKRPFESFIEITQLAPGREYLLDVDLIDSDETTSYRTVNTVAIVGTNDFGGNNRKPDCRANYFNPEYEVDNSFLIRGTDRGQSGLILEVSSTGTQVLDNDDDYECVYRHQVEVVNGGRDWRTGDVVRIHQSGGPDRQDGDDASYEIEVTDTTTVRSSAEFLITGVITPSTGDQVLKVRDVLTELKAELVSQAGFNENEVEIVGNGLYITRDEPFTISTTEKDLMNILSNEDEDRDNPYVTVNDVSRLPIECRDGLVAKVANSFTSDDDYWVQFVANYGNDSGSKGATGYWVEVAEPGGVTKFNPASMPHALVYARKSDGQTAFVVGPISWAQRTCGTEDFNPSFNKFNINHTSFFRNRLVFLSQENVIMSRPGDLFNFFPGSALGVASSDPIDISASTDFSSVLQDSLVINNGLVLFSGYQQFLLTTDSDILDPTTAKISEISRYEYNSESRPFAIGTNIGFLGTSSVNTRLYEVSSIFREGSVEISELSAIIQKSLPSEMDLVTQSKETGLIMLSKTNTKNIWCYRYLRQGNNRQLQSVWFRWEAPHKIRYHFIIDNVYYCIMEGEGRLILSSVSLETMQGPWNDLGNIPYEMKVKFPIINLTRREGEFYKADTTSSLVVHRAIFNFADIGTYEIKVDRAGYDDYNILYESRYMDDYEANEAPVWPEVERNVPIYTRNDDVHITLSSNYEHPLILRSMRWEGDYNTRFYRRV